jgi:hypothetical protein
VKIAIEQAVAVPPARAVAVYGSPDFYRGRPRRDDIEVREVLDHQDTGSYVLIAVRFAFTGSVSPAVRRVVDPSKLSWVTRTDVYPAEARTVWRVLPDNYPDRLTASGTYRFTDGPSPGSTLVQVEGDLAVHVPLVGRSVERAIVSGLRNYILDEVASIPDHAE